MKFDVQLTAVLTSAFLILFQGTSSSDEGGKWLTKSNYQFIRVVPSTIEQVISLNTLEEVYEEEHKAIFLRSAGPPDTPIDIVLIDNFDKFTEDLKSVHIPYTVENVEDKLVEKLRKRRDVSDHEYDHTRYHTYDEIIAWLKTLVQRHKNIASLISIGKTFEGRDMYAMKISSETGSKKKPGIWIEGGVHAREKISPATVVFIIQQLLEQYGNDDIVTDLVDGIVWYLLPVLNIDGYEYAMIPMENVTSILQYFNNSGLPPDIHDQMWWRKTRSVYNHTSCVGVDPNRNWDYKWKASPIVRNDGNETVCSNTYSGPEPFSEVEVKNIANFLLEHSYIDVYLSLHSYGQLFLFPWCWTRNKSEHYDELKKLAEKASNAIKSVYGTEYRSGSVTEIFSGSLIGGCSCDWTYGVAGIKYSYGIELRDNGVYRFFLPEDQIEPTGTETFEGFKAIASHLISLDHNAAASSLSSLPYLMGLTRLCFLAVGAIVVYRA